MHQPSETFMCAVINNPAIVNDYTWTELGATLLPDGLKRQILKGTKGDEVVYIQRISGANSPNEILSTAEVLSIADLP